MHKNILLALFIVSMSLFVLACGPKSSPKTATDAVSYDDTTVQTEQVDQSSENAETETTISITDAVLSFCSFEESNGCEDDVTEESLSECVDSELHYYEMMAAEAPKCQDVLDYALDCMIRYSCDNEDRPFLDNEICEETADYREYFNCLKANNLCDIEILKRCGGAEYPERSHRD